MFDDDASMETYFILANHAPDGDILSYDVYPYDEESMAWYDLEEANYALPVGQEARLYSVLVEPDLDEDERDALFHEFTIDGIEESGGIRLDIS